jgi:hypothetical protein
MDSVVHWETLTIITEISAKLPLNDEMSTMKGKTCQQGNWFIKPNEFINKCTGITSLCFPWQKHKKISLVEARLQSPFNGTLRNMDVNILVMGIHWTFKIIVTEWTTGIGLKREKIESEKLILAPKYWDNDLDSDDRI